MDQLRYIGRMFQVLVYVYENYWRGDACPQPEQLQRKLAAEGFDAQEIQEALEWLGGLSLATRNTQIVLPPARKAEPAAGGSPASMRAYSIDEQNRLGPQCLGFIRFLETAGVLPPHMREIVLDRAQASGADHLGLDDLKIIILMVYWSYGEEPDALILDELCDDGAGRLGH